MRGTRRRRSSTGLPAGRTGWRTPAPGLRVEAYPADWTRFGRAAGIIRNQRMLASGVDLVLAFPGGIGTADMVRRAQKAGVAVELIGSAVG